MSKKKRSKNSVQNPPVPAAAPETPEPVPAGPTPLYKKILFSLLPVILLLGAGELFARMAKSDFAINRFFYVAGGHEEYFGTQKLSTSYEVRPPYHWRGVPNTAFYNSYGLRGKEWAREKAPGRVRVAIMGCSCTLGGQEPYADRIGRLIGEALQTNKYEVMNGGIGSSSTYQILQIFQQYILPLHPDIATVFGGWNDRWVHDGRRDSQHVLPSATGAGLWDFLVGKSRLFKALVFYSDKYGSKKIEERVPPDEYGKNLRTFIKLCRDNNIRPLICTTPDGSPDGSILSRFNEHKKQRDWDSDLYDLYKDKADGPIAAWNYIQKLYNDKVKEVVASEKVDLIDLDQEITARRKLYPAPPLYLFKDGVHFTELGLQEMARTFASRILGGGELDRLKGYLDTPAYFVTNAYTFASQFQFSAAADFIQRAEAVKGGPVEGIDDLRARIASEREFYDTFDAARIEESHHGDLAHVEELYTKCLTMRPEEQNVRLELAQLEMEREEYDKALNVALGTKVDYTQQNLYRALWMGVNAANAAGRGDVVYKILHDILRLFPQDQRAKQILETGRG